MSYTPKYVELARIEQEAQVHIDSDSNPNETEILDIIQEIETEVDDKRLYRYHRVSGYEDVLPVTGLGEDTIQWFEYISHYDYAPVTGAVVIPTFQPLISVDVSGCHFRETALGVAPTWTVRNEGFDQDFIILEKQTKNRKKLGFALYFFNDAPLSGPETIRLSYVYGWDLPRPILRRYVAKRVAIEVLGMKRGANEPAGLSQFRGGDLQSYVGTQYDERIAKLEAQVEKIEFDYFPSETHVAMGIL